MLTDDTYLLARGLTGAAKWARRLGVTSLVFLGLIALVMVFTFGTLSTLLLATPGAEGLAALGTGVTGLLLALYFGVGIFLAYKFYSFGRALKTVGDVVPDAEQIERGFGHLATFFKLSVLLFAVAMALSVILPMLVFGGMAAAG